ncbi:MAG TPA: DUF222 domain-containing protein, partial [Jatrophihabitans sp.]|nr:DUF222 domain-containing protein [Jatrophihabitans sp.]
MNGERVNAYLVLTHEQRIDALAALQVEKARLAAKEQLLLHALAVDAPQIGLVPDARDKDWVREQVACVLRVAPVTAGYHLATAEQLVTELPATLAALTAGRVTFPQVLRLAEATGALPDQVTAQVEAQVLPGAGEQTAGQFGAAVKRAVARFDTRDSEQKHRRAVAERRVVFTPQDNGVSSLWALLPADAAAAIEDAVRQAAARCRGLDERTADQRRADALTDLILTPLLPTCPAAEPGTATAGTGASRSTDTSAVTPAGDRAPATAPAGAPGSDCAAGIGGLRPTVHVTVALSTLLGLDEQAGELRGHGPIPAVLARALAFDPTGTWRRILTDTDGRYLEAGARR